MTNAIEKSNKTTAMTKYESFDLEAMEEAEKALPSSANRFFKAAEGKNSIRFIPPQPGKPPIKIYYKHFFSMGGEKKSIICTEYQVKQPCAVCQEGRNLRASGREPDVEKARAYQPTAQVYVNIVDMKNPETGVQVWPVPQGLFKKFRAAIDLAGVGKTFSHPEKGFNIQFVRTGSGQNTKYDPVAVARESTPLPNADDLIAVQADLDTLESLPSDEDQEVAASGEFEARQPFKKRTGGGSSGGGSRGGRSMPNRQEEEDADISF